MFVLLLVDATEEADLNLPELVPWGIVIEGRKQMNTMGITSTYRGITKTKAKKMKHVLQTNIPSIFNYLARWTFFFVKVQTSDGFLLTHLNALQVLLQMCPLWSNVHILTWQWFLLFEILSVWESYIPFFKQLFLMKWTPKFKLEVLYPIGHTCITTFILYKMHIFRYTLVSWLHWGSIHALVWCKTRIVVRTRKVWVDGNNLFPMAVHLAVRLFHVVR